MKRRIMCSLFSLVSVFILASCSGDSAANDSSDAGGRLVLNIAMDDNAKGLKDFIPDIDMKPTGYKILGAGPNGATFTGSTSDGTFIAEGLARGAWTIVAEANNKDNIFIGQGESTATVRSNQNAQVNIIVRPLDGAGTLNLTVRWKAESVDFPSIAAVLSTKAGISMNLQNFVFAPGNATYSNTFPAGSYSLSLRLIDNGTEVTGRSLAARIVKGGITTGTYEFYDINEATGGVNITITPEMNDLLTVSMSGQVDELGLNVDSMTVTASVAENVSNLTYVWNINGNEVGTGPTYTVTPAKLGFYSLDVVASTVDGKRTGSRTHAYRVVLCGPGPVTPEAASSATYGAEGDLLYFALYPAGTLQSGFGSASGGNMIALFTAVKQSGGSWTNPGGLTHMYNSSSAPVNLSCGNYVMGVILDKGGDLANNLSPFQNLGTGDLTYVANIAVSAGGITYTLPAGIFPDSYTPTSQGMITVVVDPSFTLGATDFYLHMRLFPIGTAEEDFDTTPTISYQCYVKSSNGSWGNYYLSALTRFMVPRTSSAMTIPAGHYKVAMILDSPGSTTPPFTRISPWENFPFTLLRPEDKTGYAYVTVDGQVTFTVNSNMFFH